MIQLKLTRIQLISNLRSIKERIQQRIFREQDFSFLVTCGVLTPEEYQNVSATTLQKPKVKTYTLNDNAH